MTPRVVGSGLPRTGTTSLHAALATLTGEPSYHLHELFAGSDHAAGWLAGLDGDVAAVDAIVSGHGAGVEAGAPAGGARGVRPDGDHVRPAR